ncbi:16S rRNA methyltransferase [Gordoniibacillus kamchatkensis]|uniref:Ribosomal RNA small subunit methyltransferase I n=1 Tax=Gordoniibacillus kamchatkensis TaxID=1590651 RepID=A0ABR5AEE7_9BACL|nr:16S rRNA (cytidine(1402)-2'-O)-methyltransferase [Paenibacillus sp. VKM B-2647]KIL39433.1 16S rRNA methyltransferase [Paenibacillus sp. VKM B-2647]
MQVQQSFTGDGGSDRSPKRGVLYLVATPIGNLEDMTYRAVRILREADCIAAEDTRQTRKLLSHFDIHTRLVSYHEHNKQASGPELVRLMRDEGLAIALVSDAGLPAISDPGADLARLAAREGIAVIPVPGANAALSGLIASGLPTDRFTFIGFAPRERKELRLELERLKAAPETLLFYESPHRIEKTLEAMGEAWGMQRRVCLARELTKRYEEFVRGTIAECLEHLAVHRPQGEYVLIVEGATPEERRAAEQAWWEALTLEQHVAHYESQGDSRKDAMKKTASDRGLTKRDVYNALL